MPAVPSGSRSCARSSTSSKVRATSGREQSLNAVRVGILGGTFNPPHLGHLVCAQEAYIHLELERVLFIPARLPPHKPVEEEPGAEHRLELCRLAVRDDPRFEVSELEMHRE